MTEKIKITRNQFYQILGLVTASIELDTKRTMLAEAFTEIVGKDNEDRFWDWGVGENTGLEKSIREKLEFDGIEIEKSKLFKGTKHSRGKA